MRRDKELRLNVIVINFADVPSPPTAPLEIRQIAAHTVVISWGRPESDGGAPLEGYRIAIRDAKKTMWMEVGRVNADVQKLNIRDLQENHMYLFRIFAKNEVGLSDPLESDEPVKIIPATGTPFLFSLSFIYLFLSKASNSVTSKFFSVFNFIVIFIFTIFYLFIFA